MLDLIVEQRIIVMRIHKASSIIILKLLTLLIICFSLSTITFAGGTKLDALFVDLKNAENETEARATEEKIWLAWMESGDDKIDAMLRDAMRKRRSYDFEGGIQVLNEIIKLKPDFSEAWNQRATLYFFQKKYEESLIDIAKTLELEPRHFGSLAGRAVIRWRQSKPELARQNIIEAMKVHPFLKEQNMFPGLQKS